MEKGEKVLDILPVSQSQRDFRYIENIQTLGNVVDISDICNFYRRQILPIRWRYQRI
jgi:hypothetical protein